MPFKEMLHLWLVMRAGTEDEFWRLSWPEYANWLRAQSPKRDVMDRKTLKALMKRFPDV